MSKYRYLLFRRDRDRRDLRIES